MAWIRFYIDEDAAEKSVVDGLRRSDVDVLTFAEADRGEKTDEEQLDFASSEDRTIYSLNVAHFCRLHTEFLAVGRNQSGIVVIPRQRYSLGEKIRRLLTLVGAVTAEQMKNRLEYL